MTGFQRFTPQIGAPLPRIRPENAGVSPAAVLKMIRSYAEKGLRIHSFLLIRDGRVYSEGYYAPYAPDLFQTVYSLSKSFTSVAMGIAEGEGLLSLDEKIEDIFAEEIKQAGTQPSKELSGLTVRNLLRMGTGQEKESWSGTDHILSFLKEPFHEMPGEHFRYNTAATYMCAATLWKKGIDLEAYLQEKLFGPLGISGAHWQRCARGICTGGYGLSILPEIIAKFGVLLAGDGVFEGRQLIPKGYLDQATTKQISNAHHSPNPDWQAGYGYQFWMCQNGSFRGDGMYGQLCVVNRAKNAVLAMTAFVDDIQAELSVYFDEILSQMADAPIPEEPEAFAALQAELKGLRAAIQPVVDDGGAIPKSVLGKEYRLGPHSLRVEEEGGKLSLHASFYGEPVVLPRGRTGQYLLPTNLGANKTGIAVFSPAVLGYGVRGGKLALRILSLEFMFDVSIEIGEDGLNAWHVYDVNHHKRIEHIGF